MAVVGSSLNVSDTPDIHCLTGHRAATQAKKKGQSQGMGVPKKGLLGCATLKPKTPIIYRVVRVTLSQAGQVAKGAGPVGGGAGLGGRRNTTVKIQY